MEKDWYDKYGKEFHCADCTFLDSCLNKDAPLHSKCYEQYLKDRIVDLEAKLAKKEQDKISFTIEQLEKVKSTQMSNLNGGKTMSGKQVYLRKLMFQMLILT